MAVTDVACAPPVDHRGDGGPTDSPRGDAGDDREAGAPLDATTDDGGADAAPPDAGDALDDASALDALDAGDALDEADATAEAAVPTAPWIAFVTRRDGNEDIWVVRSDGSDTRQITTWTDDDFAPTFTPDGARIVFASVRHGMVGLYLHDLATNGEAPVVTGLPSATSPRVSPDGLTVAFEGNVGPTSQPDIYLVPIGGGVPVQLTTATQADVAPVWAPDGRSVYFLSNRGGPYDIWNVNTDGTGEHAVTTGARVLGRFDVSPDGRYAVFQRAAAGSTFPLFRRELATTSGAEVMLANDLFGSPAFSPTGDRLAVSTLTFAAANPEIALIDAADATHVVRLTTSPGLDDAPAWSPVIR